MADALKVRGTVSRDKPSHLLDTGDSDRTQVKGGAEKIPRDERRQRGQGLAQSW